MYKNKHKINKLPLCGLMSSITIILSHCVVVTIIFIPCLNISHFLLFVNQINYQISHGIPQNICVVPSLLWSKNTCWKPLFLLKIQSQHKHTSDLFSLDYWKFCSPNFPVSYMTKKAGNMIEWRHCLWYTWVMLGEISRLQYLEV